MFDVMCGFGKFVSMVKICIKFVIFKWFEMNEIICFFVKLIIVVLIFCSFLFLLFSIFSELMLLWLLIGDYLFVLKWNYGFLCWLLLMGVLLIFGWIFVYMLVCGDVVVFCVFEVFDYDVIKCVIGLLGDIV